jgi:hypothetical protein
MMALAYINTFQSANKDTKRGDIVLEAVTYLCKNLTSKSKSSDERFGKRGAAAERHASVFEASLANEAVKIRTGPIDVCRC